VCIEVKRNVYRILVGQYDIRVKEGNVRMDLKEIGCKGMHWILLAKYRDRWWAVVSTVMNRRYHKIQGIYYLTEELLPLKKDSAPCSSVKDQKAKLCLSMPWSYIGNRGIFPLILNFGVRWSLVVNFMLHFIIFGNEHFYPLNRMPYLDILEKKKILLLSGFGPWTVKFVP
jgi:hypothetical protein